MKLLSLLSAAALVALAQAATSTPAPVTPKPSTTNAVAPDCTLEQRQTVNKLLDQNVNPAKGCYAKAKEFGDLLTISTVRLCPITQCKEWLEYMATNTPDCVYDDTNYGRQFIDKYQDCLDPAAAAAKTPAPTPTTTPETEAGDEGLGSEAGVVTPKPTTAKPKTPKPTPALEAGSSSGSADTEIEPVTVDNSTIAFPDETSEAPVASTSAPRATVSSAASSLAVGATVMVATAVALVL